MSDTPDQARKSDDESVSVVVVTPAEAASVTGDEKMEDVAAPDADEGTIGNGSGHAAGATADSNTAGDSEEEKKEKQMVGLVAESKDLYAKLDQHGNRSWTEKKPDDLEEAAENEETEKYAIIVRKRESFVPL